MYASSILQYTWQPRYVQPQPWLPDAWDAPFFYEDRRHLFYVSNHGEPGRRSGGSRASGSCRPVPALLASGAGHLRRLVLRQPVTVATPPEVLAATAADGDPAAVQRFVSAGTRHQGRPGPAADDHLSGPADLAHREPAVPIQRRPTDKEADAMHEIQGLGPFTMPATSGWFTSWEPARTARVPSSGCRTGRSSPTLRELLSPVRRRPDQAAQPDLGRRDAGPGVPGPASHHALHPGGLHGAGQHRPSSVAAAKTGSSTSRSAARTRTTTGSCCTTSR